MEESCGVQLRRGQAASTMIRVIRICRKCGAKIFSDAPEGLCAKCVLKTALGNFLDAPVAGVADPGRVDEPSNAAAHDKKAASAAELLGELGDYELLEEIGRGGQGVVFRARQKSLNRIVALKVISLGQWASKVHLRRFRLEAEAAAKLEHPGIVPIHEVGERDGSCYFSMKFVEGGQVDEVARREPMPIRRAMELMVKVARTVHYAHEHGILHRDIKPGNILLDAKGEPHLTDFGLARLVESESSVTNTLEVLGTPSYMAPEQAVGNNAAISSVTDVYGLGGVLYQLLTGHPPFAGGTTYETIKLLLDTEPRQPRLWNPKIDRDLSTICLKCLEKDPNRRYSSALALAEDLERWLKHEPILARRVGLITRGRKWVRRNPSITVMAALLLALAVPLGVIVWKSAFVPPPRTTGIAVLPFENLSEDKENPSFADGIQDDILTKLAKVSDLKVISRTSVMEYRGKQNVREIGEALRVSHILEGSVRRNGSRIRLNAQLIDTRTDHHVWAQEYDRDLNDLFTVETQVAQSIANRLEAKISASEKASIEERPTKDLIAYDLYVRASSLMDWITSTSLSTIEKNLLSAVDLLNQAVARDPSFVRAYCKLAQAHDTFYFQGIDRTPARLALAKSAIDSAFRLKPDSGEAHLALAEHIYYESYDYARARAELALAQRALPNDAEVLWFSAIIDRRQGRWSDVVRKLKRAIELDPRNAARLFSLARNYLFLRDYEQAVETYNRGLVIDPNNISARIQRATIDVDRRADTRTLHNEIEKILVEDPFQAANDEIKRMRFLIALWERDTVGAARATGALPQKDFLGDTYAFSRDFWVGVFARMKGDTAAARAAFTAARTVQEAQVRAQPDYPSHLAGLGIIDAVLGRKEEALREGRQAIELAPVEKNSIHRAFALTGFALICTWVGERDLAITQLEDVAKMPGGPTYGALRLDPLWDPLRDDPRFEKIVSSLAPK
jgi:TolB-like protein/tRNA A-37 threonylcarbamoyl transferase component Bud32/Flp pilus assembly protein TadD